MKNARFSILLAPVAAAVALRASADIDPRTNSWFTAYSGQYARIYTSDVNKTNGTTVTTWSTGSTAQALPAYCGVQEVYSSSNWVYILNFRAGVVFLIRIVRVW